MSIIKKIYNKIDKFFSQGRLSPDFFREEYIPWWGDSFTDDLIKTLNDCKRLLTEENPRAYVNFSNLIYKIFPLYKKAIRLRSIFVGTIRINDMMNSPNKNIAKTIKYIQKKLPIYDSNTIVAKGYGINSLLNMISEDCDLYGMAYCQLKLNGQGNIDGVYIYKPSLFYFDYDNDGVKRIYYNDKAVDTSNLYIFSYQTVRGYDWGAPLIYGNKFMGDNIIKLINAQLQGLMRNMNPFDLTVISTDIKQLEELPEEQQTSIKKAIEALKKDIISSAQKSLKGESVHLFTNIPTLASFNNSKAASTITFIDPKTLGIFIELFCAGVEIPFQLMMDTTGSMNTDKYKAALLMMEAWASEYARPQLLPIIEKLILDIFFLNNIPVTDTEIEVELLRNETLMQSLDVMNTPEYPIRA